MPSNLKDQHQLERAGTFKTMKYIHANKPGKITLLCDCSTKLKERSINHKSMSSHATLMKKLLILKCADVCLEVLNQHHVATLHSRTQPLIMRSLGKKQTQH